MTKIILLLTIFLTGSVFIACSQKTTSPEKPPTQEVQFQEIKTAGKEPREAEWEKTLALAKKEGKVVIYMAPEFTARDVIIKAMQRNSGLEAEVVLLRSAELWPKLLGERRAGLFYNDIIIQGGLAPPLIPPGISFGPLEPHLILPEVKEPGNWREGRIPWFDKNKKVLATSQFVIEGATINTDKVVKGELKSYQDLLNPKWKNLIVANDPSIQGKGTAQFQTMEKLMGRDFMRQLAKQEPVMSRDHRQMAEWIGRGKYAIGIGITTEYAEDIRKTGLPIDYVEFKEGAMLATGPSLLVVMDNIPHPKATTVFINWFLSREGQKLITPAVNMGSRRIDISTEGLTPIAIAKAGVKYFEQTEETFAEWPELMGAYREIFAPSLR